MIALVTGHPELSDWSFLLALVVFVVAAVLAVLRTPARAADGNVGPSGRAVVAVLPLVGSALLALGLLVL